MLYRAAPWKLANQDIPLFKQDMSLSRRRQFTKRPVKVDIPVPIVDQREVAFCYFTEIASIDRKRKKKPGYHLKHQNTFLAWFGRSANSSAIVVSGCDSTGVSASTKCRTPNKLLAVNDGNVSKMNKQMQLLETAVDLEPCTSLPSNDFRPMTVKIDIERKILEDCDSKMTRPTRKALVKQVNSVDLIVAMLKVLSLEDKRKLKESDKEHFETFHAHRPYARPFVKRMKVSNN